MAKWATSRAEIDEIDRAFNEKWERYHPQSPAKRFVKKNKPARQMKLPTKKLSNCRLHSNKSRCEQYGCHRKRR